MTRIFSQLQSNRKESFVNLFSLSTDPAFITQLVTQNRQDDILSMMVDQNLTGFEAASCLVCLLHLLKLNHIDDIGYNLLVYLITLAKTETDKESLPLSYAVLSQILFFKGQNYNKHKEKIVSDLSISGLVQNIKYNTANNQLATNTLQLVNAMVRAVQGDKRTQLIKEMDLKANKAIIYSFVIEVGPVDKILANELYVYQSFLLR